jgi:hypothetical protein
MCDSSANKVAGKEFNGWGLSPFWIMGIFPPRLEQIFCPPEPEFTTRLFTKPSL